MSSTDGDLDHLGSLGHSRAKVTVQLTPSLYTTYGLMSGSKSNNFCDDEAVLSKRAPRYRPLLLMRRIPPWCRDLHSYTTHQQQSFKEARNAKGNLPE